MGTGGCLNEADLPWRCGGGMSVFLGEVGLWKDDCAGDRTGACLRGEGGATVDAAPLVGAGALVLVVDATLKAPVRSKL